jgi:NADH-quinone oxidoreductase subunit C
MEAEVEEERLAQELKEKLRELFVEYELKPHVGKKRIFIRVKREGIRESAKLMFEGYGGRLSTISCVEHASFFELLYHFSLDSRGIVVTLRVETPKQDPSVDSITGLIEGAGFIEREIHDLFGVKFSGHPRPERLILAESWPKGEYPLRKER